MEYLQNMDVNKVNDNKNNEDTSVTILLTLQKL